MQDLGGQNVNCRNVPQVLTLLMDMVMRLGEIARGEVFVTIVLDSVTVFLASSGPCVNIKRPLCEQQ